ncbi:hypothetical protein Hamer_G026856 [Homarus americanus]|uniref:Uncharacterized protein n=1 Tax=Homarus americanus TaxID=6706 RepID=A0A8J5MNH3_HOMAM|nr:hypothetical protein Hamer_G026856 [Homarus americanus]
MYKEEKEIIIHLKEWWAKHCSEFTPQEEWIHIGDDIEVAATFTDQEIIQSITTPEKRIVQKNLVDNKVKEKISWAAAEKGIEPVIKFVEQNHSFSLQDAMHVNMVQNNLITKKLQSRKQGDIRKYLKKAVSSSAADAVEAASVPSTSSAADDIEVVEMNE